ncbi:MAG: radical SAM protein [Deltaproteobacteria bacterium]|nr:MAG: radical SAM protein [Deltaproteobacteria bacterium]
MKKDQLSTFLETQNTIKDFESKGLDTQGFCLVPFTNIILEPNGDVGVCRQKGTEFTVGNLRENTLEEVWNGETIRKWRREFLDNKVSNCSSEIKYKKCNLCPQNNQLLDYVEYSEVQSNLPIKLTANFNGFCNLRCQMCDVWEMPNGFYTEENFWSFARKDLFPGLHEIDMLSGEPFLQNDTWKLIDEVSSINPDCKWTITTNAHYQLSEKMKNELNKISFKNLIISMDSLDDETYAKIRKRGQLKTVRETLNDFLSYQKERMENGLSSLSIKVNFLIQKDNWREIKNMIQFCEDREISPFITFCHIPSEHSLLDLSDDERMRIIRSWLGDMDYQTLAKAGRVIRPMVDSLSGIDRAEVLSLIQSLKMSAV